MAKVKTFAENVTAALNGLRDGNDMDAGKVGSLIKSIKSRGKKLDVDIHVAAVAALTLSSLHRDCNMAKLLLNSMPQSARAATLALWFETFGNIIVTAPTAKVKEYRCKMKPEAECVPVDLVKAEATPFWSKRETVSGAFDDAAFAKAVAALIKKAEKDTAVLSPKARAAVADLKVLRVKLPEVEEANA